PLALRRRVGFSARATIAFARRTSSSLPPFFFQAEDGIRAATVTGVQTCALPISCRNGRRSSRFSRPPCMFLPRGTKNRLAESNRSEERRVGKECRSSRWEDLERKRDEGD